MATKTPDEVRAEFKRKGISISQWATANGISVLIVYQLLSGRRKGDRGESHRAAILLGLKEGEIVGREDVQTTMNNKARFVA